MVQFSLNLYFCFVSSDGISLGWIFIQESENDVIGNQLNDSPKSGTFLFVSNGYEIFVDFDVRF